MTTTREVGSSEPPPAVTTDAEGQQLDLTGIRNVPAQNGGMERGRYILPGPGYLDQHSTGWPPAVTVTVPEGWSSWSRQRGGGLFRANAKLDLGSVGNVVADPCPPELPAALDPQVGPTVDELASALASIPGVATSAPVEVTFHGFEGVQMTLTVPTSLADCDFFYLWATPKTDGEFWYVASQQGWLHRLWILDVAGLRFVVDASSAPDSPVEVRLELLRVVSSIEFQP